MEIIFAIILIIAAFALMFNVLWIVLQIWFAGWIIEKIVQFFVWLVKSIIEMIKRNGS